MAAPDLFCHTRSHLSSDPSRSQLRVAARVTQLAYLAQQARGPNPRIRLDPFAQVRPIRVQQLRPRRPRTVARRLSPEVIRDALLNRQRSVLRHTRTGKRYVIPSSATAEAQLIYQALGLSLSDVPYALN